MAELLRRTFLKQAAFGSATLLSRAAGAFPTLGAQDVLGGALRTPDERFANWPEYAFAPHYQYWRGLRMHYVDEGVGDPMLMLHGQPTSSYLYRRFVRPLAQAGYRCLAPDYIGFGKSDKIVDDSWYVIERHVESVRYFIEALDLRNITLVVHDWGGPIGLRQAVDMPDRINRVIVLNTWLHHDGMPYSDGIKQFRARVVVLEPGKGDYPIAPPTGDLGPAYNAPFPDFTYKAGPRRFPQCHPYANPVDGNADDQARCFEAFKRWKKPAHFIWGESDIIFPKEWGHTWSTLIPDATFDLVPGRHFLQEPSSPNVVSLILSRIQEEAR